MSDPKIIPTGYDIEKHPDADVFDPIAWYEGTGEDLGLPPGYLEDRAKFRETIRAEREAKMRAEAEAEAGN